MKKVHSLYIRSGLLLCALTLPFLGKGQYYSYPNDYFNSLLTERRLARMDSSSHSSMKPYIHFFSDKYINEPDTHRIFKYVKEDPALDIVFFHHMVDFKPRGYDMRLVIDPLVNFSLGNDYYNDNKNQNWGNSRGIIGSAYIGKKVYFETLFSENQTFFPDYVLINANITHVIPGQGRWKSYKGWGYDYGYSSGFFSVQASKNINIQAGHGKHKIGFGYRSLLLSDNAFNYPYARITQQWLRGRIQYTNLYSVLTNYRPASANPSKLSEPLFQKKPAAFQYLSVNPTKFINLGLYQGIMWTVGDSKNRQQLAWEYFDPLIFVNAGTRGLKDTCNIMIGADLRIKLGHKISLYGQIAADDPRTDSMGLDRGLAYQTGICFYDVFKVKNLFLQAEYNDVQEGMYASTGGVIKDQSFYHLNQPITFSPGYGKEWIFIADYKMKRLFFNARYHYQTIPLNGDYYYDTQIVNMNMGFMINTSYNLSVSLGYTYRNQKFPNFKDKDNQTNYIFASLRTGLHNFYYDY